ncbi:Cobalamin biosynthesis protein CobD [Rubrobacter xylanophilus DSM 9941]|uniref:adenosylcobinamide-phosphate synthase CbiB n=1 Tax=Rubrobacter xylanophilus TaxID=49319 RepID=UPI001C63E751|nr:adenosylcobinamide-phosphate synthase CbiB [Rubrobacter xylanophilus]QYJ16849.1 Cobalamin biosynthesis protein CobD [Rubrobacter xylanophilus DSM 9941]
MRPDPRVLLAALALDLALGEPPERVHPVVWTGRLVSLLERRAPSGRRVELLWGALLAAAAALVPALSALVALRLPLPRLLVEAYLLKCCLSWRALEEAALGVVRPLEAGGLGEAREALRFLVSRDRSGLDRSLVAAAAVESLAENLGDGFVAPLLFYAAGGLPAAALHRGANTADAMVGYRGRHEYLGKASAWLDDLLNLLPARLSALLIVAASGRRSGAALAVALREHRKTASPNAGWPMAAAAGGLGLVLRKPGHYAIGAGREPEPRDVRRAISLCRRAAALAALGAVLLCRFREVGR